MIDLVYEWCGDEYTWKLFKLKDGQKYFIENFRDREDILIYVEENYKMAKIIVIGE